MSSADYIAERIREAADNPKAPLLFAIGAESSSPSSAASKAYALGLTVAEEKLAKWVAVLKRDAPTLFGTSFEEALRNIIRQGEQAVEVLKGEGYYKAQLWNAWYAIGGEVDDRGNMVGCRIVNATDRPGFFGDEGIPTEVLVRVEKKKFMPIGRKIARRIESMTRRKGFQKIPTKVTIIQDF